MKRLPLFLVLLFVPFAAAQGSGLTVAVVDSGIDSDHPEVAGRVTRMSFVEFVSVPGDLPPDVQDQLDPGQLQEDPDGQGTAVASLVAGATLGVAPGADILDLQVSGGYTGGAIDPPMEKAAAEALDWLLEQDDLPDVVVLSFAAHLRTEEASRTLVEQARGLWQRGVVVVLPAPEPLDGAAYTSLHRSPAVITVAGLDGTDPTAAAAPDGLTKPDLSAQSVGITVAAPMTSPADPETAESSGQALASAHVAGAALLALAEQSVPPAALAAIFHDTAQDVGATGFDTRTGFGEVQADLAATAAGDWTDPVPPGTEDIDSRDTPSGLLAILAILGAAVCARRR